MFSTIDVCCAWGEPGQVAPAEHAATVPIAPGPAAARAEPATTDREPAATTPRRPTATPASRVTPASSGSGSRPARLDPQMEAVLAGYRQTFASLQKKYLDYPSYVHIETNARCNARCRFCPQRHLERRNQDMPDALFLKIIDDLKAIPRELPFRLSPFKVNEMMLDRQIFDRIRLINRQLPQAAISVFSNFALIDARAAEEILAIRNLHGVTVSLNSVDPEEYREMMGLDLARTVANVKGFLDTMRRKGVSGRVVLARICDGTPADARFVRGVREVFSDYAEGRDYQISPKRRGEWMGHVAADPGHLELFPCAAWFELSITCTGRVALCCMDGHCEYPLGDANSTHVLKIYNDAWYRALRETAPERRHVAPCRTCSMLQ